MASAGANRNLASVMMDADAQSIMTGSMAGGTLKHKWSSLSYKAPDKAQWQLETSNPIQKLQAPKCHDIKLTEL
jgi:hypothetical protein